MKKLYVVRHAKSSWEVLGQSDFERPLNDRGEKDAPRMAKKLFEKGVRLDAIVSSPALRAFSTAQYFAEQFGFKKKDILLVNRLYHAATETFYDVIAKELKDSWNEVAIFSHNPGITHFVNDTGVIRLDNMPTCGVLGVEAEILHWHQFLEAEKRLILFDYPKNHE